MMRTQSIEAGSFHEWFEGLPAEQRFDILRDYAVARRGVLWTDAMQQSIAQVLGDDTYVFGLHAAMPFSRKDGFTSRFGHMWISITAERTGAGVALGYYPATRAWRDLLGSSGHVDDEETHAYHEYAVMTAPITPAAIVRILMLARTGFTGNTYRLGGLFGGFDCISFADSAALLAGLQPPSRGANFWSWLPYRHIRKYCLANSHVADFRCMFAVSVWENCALSVNAWLARLTDRVARAQSTRWAA